MEIFNDLTDLAVAPDVVPGTKLDAYVSPWNSQQHVDAVSTDAHVHELMYDGSKWNPLDLTTHATPETNGVVPTVTAGSPLVGYVSGWNVQQHVDFIGGTDAANDDIHELMFDNQWHFTDLTTAGGAEPTTGVTPAPVPGSPLVGFVSAWNSQQHVDFIGQAENLVHVHELMFNGTQWIPTDISAAAGPETVGQPIPTPEPGSPLIGYVSTWNSQQHVDFIGTDGAVHELMYDTKWHATNLTGRAGAELNTGATPSAAASNSLDGYTSDWNTQQHVNFVGAEGDVHELMFDTTWHATDLSLAAGAPSAAAGSSLDGYTSTWNEQQHVDFVDVTGDVHELWYDTSWHQNDLTSNATVPWTEVTGRWTVPTVIIPPLQPAGSDGKWHSLSWVGIDGTNGSSDVLQAGVDQRVDQNGNASYSPWYEWFIPGSSGPSYIHETKISKPVGPGDVVTVTVKYNNLANGSISMTNLSQNWTFSKTLAAPPGATFAGNTIEWIMEDPNSHEPGTALASFTPVSFTMASGTDLHGGIGNPKNGAIWDLQLGTTLLTTTTVGDDSVLVNFLAWGSNDLTQIADADAGAGSNVSPIDGYASPWNEQQHVDFVSADTHVVELMYDGVVWNPTDLTSNAGPEMSGMTPVPGPASPIVGYVSSWNSQQHVDFIGGADDHVHELMFDGAPPWHPTDLTLAGGPEMPGAPPPTPGNGSPLIGYVSPWNSQQHVDFIGTDNNVHELMFNGTPPWLPTNLTASAGPETNGMTPIIEGGSRLDGYISAWNQQQHVNFVGTDGHVYELMYDTKWHLNDLTSLAGPEASSGTSPTAAPGTATDGYTSDWNQQQHVNFIGTDGDVHEFMYDSSWHATDLTSAASSAPGGAAGSSLDGYASGWNEQQHVNYADADGHVHELMYDDAWHDNDLLAQSTGSAPATFRHPAIAGFVTPWNFQQHVDFIRVDGDVEELLY